METEEELDLNLSLRQYSPPRSQLVFACCYCPRKFRSPHALGGHQNAHRLQRALARRVTALWLSAAAELGKAAADDHSAPPCPGAHALLPRRHHQQGTGTGSGAASSGTRRGNEELVGDGEAIDLSLKL